MDEIIKLLKERILLAEKKKGEYDTLEMDAFWDGQMRCAQDLLNKVSRLTRRAQDAARPRCKVCGTTDHHIDENGFVIDNPPRQ